MGAANDGIRNRERKSYKNVVIPDAAQPRSGIGLARDKHRDTDETDSGFHRR
jgi:hypothetical protein